VEVLAEKYDQKASLKENHRGGVGIVQQWIDIMIFANASHSNFYILFKIQKLEIVYYISKEPLH